MRGPNLTTLGVRPPLWREARIGLEAAALLRDPLFRGDGVVDGRGRPVLLIPGFLAGDGSLSMMAGWLKRAGYRPSRAGLVANVNCSGVLIPRLEKRLERLVSLQGKQAAIVGQSRGGTLAKVLAYRRPELVAGVVTLGSPQIDPLAVHPLVRLQVEAVSRLGSLGAPGLFKRSCLDGDCCSSFWEDLARPLPEPLRPGPEGERQRGVNAGVPRLGGARRHADPDQVERAEREGGRLPDPGLEGHTEGTRPCGGWFHPEPRSGRYTPCAVGSPSQPLPEQGSS